MQTLWIFDIFKPCISQRSWSAAQIHTEFKPWAKEKEMFDSMP